jgi:hypothetical protein
MKPSFVHVEHLFCCLRYKNLELTYTSGASFIPHLPQGNEKKILENFLVGGFHTCNFL